MRRPEKVGADAAARLHTAVAILRYWRHRGSGSDGLRLGRRVVYRREDLDRWALRQRNAEARR